MQNFIEFLYNETPHFDVSELDIQCPKCRSILFGGDSRIEKIPQSNKNAKLVGLISTYAAYQGKFGTICPGKLKDESICGTALLIHVKRKRAFMIKRQPKSKINSIFTQFKQSILDGKEAQFVRNMNPYELGTILTPREIYEMQISSVFLKNDTSTKNIRFKHSS